MKKNLFLAISFCLLFGLGAGMARTIPQIPIGDITDADVFLFETSFNPVEFDGPYTHIISVSATAFNIEDLTGFTLIPETIEGYEFVASLTINECVISCECRIPSDPVTMTLNIITTGYYKGPLVLTGYKIDAMDAPEPASILLLGTGIIGIGMVARRKLGKK